MLSADPSARASRCQNTRPCPSSSSRLPNRCRWLHDHRRRSLAVALAVVDPSELIVVSSTPEQYFPAADLHATCFGHSNTPNQALFERFDRVWGLQINDDLARRGAGSYRLLLAFDPTKAPSSLIEHLQQPLATAAAAAGSNSPSNSIASNGSSGSSNPLAQLPDLEVFTFPRLGYWLSRTVDKQVWPQLGSAFAELGIVGVAQVDTFGDIIPPRTLSASRDGAVGWVKRDGYAYISNVAVSPACRRSGVAVRLMAEAETLAAAWGCDKAALHCNPSNTAAMQLYQRLRYKKAALEAPWMPYLQGRAPDRCYLLVKRLKAPKQQQQQQGQQQQEQQPAAAAAAAAVTS